MTAAGGMASGYGAGPGPGIVMPHSRESGQFFACDRVEFERLAAMIKRGDLDAFLGMRERSAVADGDPDWTRVAPEA